MNNFKGAILYLFNIYVIYLYLFFVNQTLKATYRTPLHFIGFFEETWKIAQNLGMKSSFDRNHLKLFKNCFVT